MDTPDMEPNEQDLETRVGGVLELMRPAIKEDGGDVELVEISSSGVVTIRFLGACIGCPSSSHTLHQGIERLLKERVPEVTGVEAVEGR
jgi:Fe-S cluster biogenesis protein NfuA